MSYKSGSPEFDALVGYATYEHNPRALVSRLLIAYNELDEAMHENLSSEHSDDEQLQILDFGPSQKNHWAYFGRSWVDGSMYMSIPGVNRESPVVVVTPTMAPNKYHANDIDNLITVTSSLEYAVSQIGKAGVRYTIKTSTS